MSNKHFNIKIQGIVQGVGFRPYIYRLAKDLKLLGYVNNTCDGVTIEIEGDTAFLTKFINSIKNNPPPLSNITSIQFEEGSVRNYSDFSIQKSSKNQSKITLVSPDISICNSCLQEILNGKNKRYKYPFTTCTNCGPRFSITKQLPYDRQTTAMDSFTMCKGCYIEYNNAYDRRFHAETNACSKCGPKLYAVTNKNIAINTSDPIKFTIEKLNEGYIFVIKGLCGFHLVCNAKNSSALAILRNRKGRPDKPFAVMMKDLQIVKKYCYVNSLEEEMLTGSIRPIVILKQKKDCSLPYNIAPNQNTLGVMLPYTPLHYLLFEDNIEVLIMTSANISSLPLEYENATAINNLSALTDYFLMHNRSIETALDDSVVKYTAGKIRIIRRARGFVPVPINFSSNFNIFACGADMKNTFSFTKNNYIFTSQYNGDLQNLETMNRYKVNIEHFKNIFEFSPENIVHDLHPSYYSTAYSQNESAASSKIIKVQHHHAHIVSCMTENNLADNVIGIAYDGTGYGTDNTIWGGEFLLCSYKIFKRLGHISYAKIPGGDIAIKEPWRMAVSYIYAALQYEKNNIHSDCYKKLMIKYNTLIKNLYNEGGLKLFKLLDANCKFYNTSSIGRLFDAASSIIGIRQYITYEGQASIELEAIINSFCTDTYNYEINTYKSDNETRYVIDTSPIILGLINDKALNISKSIMSSKFHNTVINFTIEMCEVLRSSSNINKIALSGGVFQNSYILENLIYKLEKLNFDVYSQKLFPCNDGGISVGQIAIANAILS